MKIIEIIPQLSQGGGERFVVDLCNSLVEKNEVLLVILYPLDNFGFFIPELSKKVRIISMNKGLGFDFSLFLKIRKLIQAEKPDVVHTHLRALLYIALSISLKNTKFVHTVHSDAAKEASDVLSRNFRKFVFKHKIVHPVTISEESQDSFTNFYHIDSSLICNGSTPYHTKNSDTYIEIQNEFNCLRANKDSLLLVNVARIQPEKNQLVLAKAIDNLNKKGFKIDLFIIGAKNDSSIVEGIENLSSPYIHLLGPKTNPRDYMYVADVFCLSSLFEGMPITLIECFSVGTVPICSSVGGIKNMITDGYNGLLSKTSSQNDIEETFMRYFKFDNEQVNLLKLNSAKSFIKYSINECTNKYLNLMNQLINK